MTVEKNKTEQQYVFVVESSRTGALIYRYILVSKTDKSVLVKTETGSEKRIPINGVDRQVCFEHAEAKKHALEVLKSREHTIKIQLGNIQRARALVKENKFHDVCEIKLSDPKDWKF